MMLHALGTLPQMTLAYYGYGGGWGFGWWWWWLVILFFIWLLFLPPYSYGRRWYGTRRGTGVGLPPGTLATGTSDYVSAWQTLDSRFIDSPLDAASEADRTIAGLLNNRNVAGMSDEYRAAHEILERNRHGTPDTDELRRAMVAYRSMYERLAGSETAR